MRSLLISTDFVTCWDSGKDEIGVRSCC